jgi:hypothetical protein
MLFSLTFSHCSVFAQRFVPQDIGNFLNQRCEIERFSNIIHDAQTGEEVYGRNRFTPRASFTASPWAYNGKLFFLSKDGVTYVVEAGPEFKQLHTNSLDKLCLASPAACQGKLLIRTASRLYCFSNSMSGMDKEGR